jgi:hypothetical protein
LQAAVLTIVCNKSYRGCPGVESTYMHAHIHIHTYRQHTHTHTHTHTQANNIICTKLQKPTLIYVAILHFILQYSQTSYTTVQPEYSWCILHFTDRNNSHQNNTKLWNQLRKICRWKRKESNNEKERERKVTTKNLRPETSSLFPFKFIAPK